MQVQQNKDKSQGIRFMHRGSAKPVGTDKKQGHRFLKIGSGIGVRANPTLGAKTKARCP